MSNCKVIQRESRGRYTQGVCEDGAAILKDGRRMTIEEILIELHDGQVMRETFTDLAAAFEKNAMNLTARRTVVTPEGDR